MFYISYYFYKITVFILNYFILNILYFYYTIIRNIISHKWGDNMEKHNKYITNSIYNFYIDIGINNTSIFIEKDNKYIIEFIKNKGKDENSKIIYLMEVYDEILNKYNTVSNIYIEDTYYNSREPKGFRSTVTAINIIQILSYKFNRDINIELINPSTIKKIITGSGRGKKEVVQYNIEQRLKYLPNHLEIRQAVDEYMTTCKRKTDIEHIQDSIALFITKNIDKFPIDYTLIQINTN